MEPDLEKVASDVRERAGVPLLILQVLRRHLPARRLLPREDGRVEQAALCSKGEREKEGGGMLRNMYMYMYIMLIMNSRLHAPVLPTLFTCTCS